MKMNQEIREEITALVENAKTAYVASVDKNGYPQIKAMLSVQHDGLFLHYFSTNLSSRRAGQFRENPKASVYFCDEEQFKGLLLTGKVEVMTDHEHKAMLWQEGDEMYYPDGVDTEDYCVYKFTAHKANYYHGLDNMDFTEEDYKHAGL